MENKFILFDCDTGADDAIAMMMLLEATNRKSVETVAITCVSGNTPLKNVVINNLRLLKLYDLLDDIPLFKGCQEALLGRSFSDTAAYVFGNDGMGDVPNVEPSFTDDLLAYVKPKHAANAIVDFANKYENQLTIIATGPLTNIALALKLEPDLPKKVKAVYVMGGTREGTGNHTPAAEFNFFVDPEAAFVTMKSFPPFCKTYLIDYGFCIRYPIPYDWIEDWVGKSKNKKETFASKILQPFIAFSRRVGDPGLVICDAYAMAILLDPSIASDSTSYDVCVELSGNVSRGHLVWNKTARTFNDFSGPVILYNKFNQQKYMEMLKKAVV